MNFNDITNDVLKKSDNDVDVVNCDSVDDMFDKLDVQAIAIKQADNKKGKYNYAFIVHGRTCLYFYISMLSAGKLSVGKQTLCCADFMILHRLTIYINTEIFMQVREWGPVSFYKKKCYQYDFRLSY